MFCVDPYEKVTSFSSFQETIPGNKKNWAWINLLSRQK